MFEPLDPLEERSLLGPLVAGPEQHQRHRRALLISAGAQVALVVILALWPVPTVIPYRPTETTIVRLDWPAMTYPVAPPPPPTWAFHLPRPGSVRVPAATPKSHPVTMHVLRSDPPAVLRLSHPKALPKPGPMAAPAAMAANPSQPLPALAAPSIGAAPIELNRFAEAAHPARVATTGSVHATAFGGTESQAITPAATAPIQVQAGGFATADTAGGSSGGAIGRIRMNGFGPSLTGDPGSSGPGQLASTGFDLTSPPPSAAMAPPLPPSYTPVKIIYQPVPVYSAEGRRLGIQGEVVLAVRFQSDGHLEVARIVRGLGHGLDEAAVAAAQGIRFQPALRNGAPIEVAALIRVTFQLAN